MRARAELLQLAEGVLRPFMGNPTELPHLYDHREKAIRAVCAGRTAVFSAGAGFARQDRVLPQSDHQALSRAS